MKKLYIFLTLPFLALLSYTNSFCNNTSQDFSSIGINNNYEVELFLNQLKSNIKNNEISTLANKTSYPIQIYRKNKIITLLDHSDFIKNYDIVFNDTVKKAISCQTSHDLTYSSQGIIIGHGAIWFGLVFLHDTDSFNESEHGNYDDRRNWALKILAINDGKPVKDFINFCEQSGQK